MTNPEYVTRGKADISLEDPAMTFWLNITSS